MPKRHWLLKTEPTVFSFDDLLAAPGRTTGWSGVRNYQARNLLRDELREGDLAFIYHSRIEPMAVVGVAEVVRAGYPDPTQFDRGSEQHDPKARPEDPVWFQVDVKAVAALRHPVTLERIKATPGLREMALLRRGNRLSVQPVTAAESRCILRMGKAR